MSNTPQYGKPIPAARVGRTLLAVRKRLQRLAEDLAALKPDAADATRAEFAAAIAEFEALPFGDLSAAELIELIET